MEHVRRPWGNARLARLALVATVSLGTPGALAEVNTGKLSLTAGSDITTAYFFRGLLQERGGAIVQPYADLGVNLYEAPDDYLSGVTLNLGTWNSFHSNQTNAGAASGGTGTLDIWYEMDWYAGATFTIEKNLSLGAKWVAYTYPNQSLKTVQEVDFTLGLDDSEWLGSWSLSPVAIFAVETDNTNGLGGEPGGYFEFDLAPGFRLLEDPEYPVDVAFPVAIGLALDSDYYGGDTFGFARYGPVMSIPLAFIPEDYGSWAMSAGVAFYNLGPNARQLNKGTNFWTVGTWGVKMTY
jgi:hypothetical protein